MKNLFFILSLSFLTLFSCSTSSDENGSSTEVVPIAPSDLSGELLGDSQVSLSWTDNSTNENGFVIERKEENGNYAEIASVNANITSFIDMNVQLSTTYIYRVFAFNSAGNSPTYTNQFSITISDAISNLIYSIKSDFVTSENSETTKLVSIDPENGNESTLVDFQTTDSAGSTSINSSTNQIFFITSIGNGNTETEIYTTDLSTNTFSVANLNNDPEIDYELMPKNNGTIFAIKQSYASNTTTSKLVSINPESGNETLILDLNTTDNFNSVAFDSQANKIYGVTIIGNGNTDCEIYSVDLSNNAFSSQPLSNEFRYELAIFDDGTLYAMEYDLVTNNLSNLSKLYSLNPTNGSKSLVIDMQTTDNFTNIITKGNKLFGVTSLGEGNSDSEIYNIDIQNNTFTTSILYEISGIVFELINHN